MPAPAPEREHPASPPGVRLSVSLGPGSGLEDPVDRRDHQHGEQRRAEQPEQQRDRQPLEDRVGEDHHRADHRRDRGEQDRLEPDRPRLDQHVDVRLALVIAVADEVHQQDRVAHDDARQRDEADHRGRRERRVEDQVAEHDAEEGQRDRRQDDERQPERAELRHHEDVDPKERHAEGRAHVAEGDPGHFPFAVPQQRHVALVVGLAMQRHHGLLARRPVDLVERRVDRDHAVKRCLEGAGKIRRHHLRLAAVVAEDREGGFFLLHLHHVAQLDHAARARKHVRRDRRRQRRLVHHPVALRSRHHDRQRRALVAAVRIADRGRAVQQAERVEDIAFLDRVELEIVRVHRGAQPAGLGAEAVIDIDDEGHPFEGHADFRGCGAPGLGIGAIDLGQQRRHHRGPGRWFDRLQAGALRQVELRDPLTHIKGDLMRAAVAVGLVRQVDLYVALIRVFAQVVMPHQPVEVERRRGAGVGLHRDHLGQLRHHLGHLLRHRIRRLDRGALGQVDHHAQLRLVVEGQEFHRDVLGVEEPERAEAEHDRRDQEGPGGALGAQHRPRHPLVERAQLAAGVMARPLGMRGHVGAPRDLHHQPGRDDHRDEKGKDHRRRGDRGNGRHVGAHQATDEQHRQQRRDHGQRGDDGRVADLGHRLDRLRDAGARGLHRPVPRDVLDHHDRVVDEDADREDQREEADAVQREAHDVRGKQRQQDRHRNDDRHHDAFPPADREEDKRDDRHRGEAEVEQELVRLLVRGLAIVAGDLHLDRRRDQRAFKLVHTFEDLLAHHHGIRPGTLRDRHRHRRAAVERAVLAGDIGHDVVRGVADIGDLRHVGHIDRARVASGQQKPRDLGRRGQRLAGDEVDLFALVAQLAGVEGAVCLLDLVRQLLQRDAIHRKLLGIGLDPDRLGRLADDIGQTDIVDLRHLGLQLARDAGQVVRADLLAGLAREGQRHDRHVVDATADDDRLVDAGGDAVHVRLDLLVHAQDRRVRGGADDEARHHQRRIVRGLRIDVLDLVDALDDGLHRLGHELHRILGLQARSLQMDVDHRHGNLRLFLARQRDQRDQTDGERRKDNQRRQRRLDESPRQPAGNAEAMLGNAERMRLVGDLVLAHSVTTSSPPVSPVMISTMSVPFSMR
ncbi:hypothetical protein SDC9_18957 [bioreactor metagenome]|uniref:Uncharacterized protein n=1 Tax=bioreactor metagenome TaxID=1076179 RepID=A0A644U1P7_9ZZZZ